MDGGEAHISAAGAVVAFVFEMIEKEAEEHGIEVGKHDFRWYLAQLLLGIGQQETEGVAVACQGMRTRLSLPDEAVGEKRLQEGWKGSGGIHGWTSGSSTRRSACRSSSSVAVRYQ